MSIDRSVMSKSRDDSASFNIPCTVQWLKLLAVFSNVFFFFNADFRPSYSEMWHGAWYCWRFRKTDEPRNWYENFEYKGMKKCFFYWLHLCALICMHMRMSVLECIFDGLNLRSSVCRSDSSPTQHYLLKNNRSFHKNAIGFNDYNGSCIGFGNGSLLCWLLLVCLMVPNRTPLNPNDHNGKIYILEFVYITWDNVWTKLWELLW